MYEILPETKDHLIALKAIGKLTDTDFELLQADLDRRLESAAPARILLDWTELEGWDATGDRRSFLFWLGEWSKIGRVAIVSAEKFASEVIQIADALSHSTVRRFAPSEADEARRWLESA
jgi:hypothetical protein